MEVEILEVVGEKVHKFRFQDFLESRKFPGFFLDGFNYEKS
jgi:hypothetical protein